MRVSISPGWRQVVVAMIIQGISASTIVVSYSVLAVSFEAAFKPSRMVLMLGVTSTMFVGAVLSPVLGAAMDRYSLRSLMLAGVGILAAGFFSLSFTTSMIQVILVYAAFMSFAIVLLGAVAASALLARWFSRRRGLAMGIAATGVSIGCLIVPPLLQGLIDVFAWRTTLRILSGFILFVVGPAVFLLTINRPADRNLYPDGDTQPPPGAAAEEEQPLLPIGAILLDPTFWQIALPIGLMFSIGTGLAANLLPIAMGKGISANLGALLISGLAVGNLAGTTGFAGIGDRVDPRAALCGCLLGLALGMFCFWRATGFPLLLVGVLLQAALVGAAQPLWGYLLPRSFGPQNVGRVMGLMSTIGSILCFITPPLFGRIFDETGSYDDAFLLCIGLSLVAIVLLPRIRTHPPAAIPIPVAS